MKNFKDLVSEVAQPKAPEERRFKDQHTIELIKHPVAPDHVFTGEIVGKEDAKLPGSQKDDSNYDKAYKKRVSQTLPDRGTGDGKDQREVEEETTLIRKSITEILGVNKKKEDKVDDDESMEEELKASCGCDESCEHCGGEHKVEEIGKECECCGNEIKGVAEGSCGGKTLNASKQPHGKLKAKYEADTDAADTIEPEVQKKKVLKGEDKPKLSPTAVTIKDSNGKTIQLTFKEMLNKVSTEEELLESPQQEIPMMQKQLHFICYAADEIQEYLKMEGQDPEEWWQNKLAEVFSNVKSLYAYAKGDQMVNGKPLSAAKIFTKAGMAYEGIEAGKFELQNNEVIEIAEEEAEVLNKMFEELNETNKKEMYNVLIADEAGYNEILSFAKENV